MLVGDEAWKLTREVIESADAALTESASPQLVLVSTAGDSSSDLFGSYRAEALDELDNPGNTLLVEWSTPRGLPIDDPDSWRLASPFWSEAREREVADKFRKLEAGEFQQNFLNWWLPTVRGKTERAVAAFSEEEVEACNSAGPVSAPLVAGVEDWFGQGLAVAFADVSEIGQARVSVRLASSAEEAAQLVEAHRSTLSEIVVGKTLMRDPAFVTRFSNLTDVMMNSRHTVTEFRRLLTDDAIRHDGSPALVEQCLAVRIVEGPNGPSVRSEGRLDAIKAAVYAARAARTLPPLAQVF
jgi:hypothetical protein